MCSRGQLLLVALLLAGCLVDAQIPLGNWGLRRNSRANPSSSGPGVTRGPSASQLSQTQPISITVNPQLPQPTPILPPPARGSAPSSYSLPRIPASGAARSWALDPYQSSSSDTTITIDEGIGSSGSGGSQIDVMPGTKVEVLAGSPRNSGSNIEGLDINNGNQPQVTIITINPSGASSNSLAGIDQTGAAWGAAPNVPISPGQIGAVTPWPQRQNVTQVKPVPSAWPQQGAATYQQGPTYTRGPALAAGSTSSGGTAYNGGSPYAGSPAYPGASFKAGGTTYTGSTAYTGATKNTGGITYSGGPTTTGGVLHNGGSALGGSAYAGAFPGMVPPAAGQLQRPVQPRLAPGPNNIPPMLGAAVPRGSSSGSIVGSGWGLSGPQNPSRQTIPRGGSSAVGSGWGLSGPQDLSGQSIRPVPGLATSPGSRPQQQQIKQPSLPPNLIQQPQQAAGVPRGGFANTGGGFAAGLVPPSAADANQPWSNQPWEVADRQQRGLVVPRSPPTAAQPRQQPRLQVLPVPAIPQPPQPLSQGNAIPPDDFTEWGDTVVDVLPDDSDAAEMPGGAEVVSGDEASPIGPAEGDFLTPSAAAALPVAKPKPPAAATAPPRLSQLAPRTSGWASRPGVPGGAEVAPGDEEDSVWPEEGDFLDPSAAAAFPIAKSQPPPAAAPPPAPAQLPPTTTGSPSKPMPSPRGQNQMLNMLEGLADLPETPPPPAQQTLLDRLEPAAPSGFIPTQRPAGAAIQPVTDWPGSTAPPAEAPAPPRRPATSPKTGWPNPNVDPALPVSPATPQKPKPDSSPCNCPSDFLNFACGADGVTYANACFPQCLRVQVVYMGPCEADNGNQASSSLASNTNSNSSPGGLSGGSSGGGLVGNKAQQQPEAEGEYEYEDEPAVDGSNPSPAAATPVGSTNTPAPLPQQPPTSPATPPASTDAEEYEDYEPPEPEGPPSTPQPAASQPAAPTPPPLPQGPQPTPPQQPPTVAPSQQTDEEEYEDGGEEVEEAEGPEQQTGVAAPPPPAPVPLPAPAPAPAAAPAQQFPQQRPRQVHTIIDDPKSTVIWPGGEEDAAPATAQPPKPHMLGPAFGTPEPTGQPPPQQQQQKQQNAVLPGAAPPPGAPGVAAPKPWVFKQPGAKKKILIGCVLPFEGDLKLTGRAIYQSLKMAIADEAPLVLPNLNINLTCINTKCADIPAHMATTRFAEEKAVAVFGEVCSAATVAAAGVAANYHMPLISPAATSPALSQKDFFFRTVPSDRHQGAAAAHLAYSQGFRNVAMVYEDASYGYGLAFNFIAAFTKEGGNVPAVIPFQKSKGKPKQTVAKLVADKETKNLDAVFLSTNNLTFVAGFLKAAEAENLGLKIFGGDALSDTSLVNMVRSTPSALDNLSITTVNKGKNPFIKHFKELNPDVPYQNFAAQAYDAMVALLRAYQAAPPPKDGKAIAEEMQLTKFDGVSGPVEFDDSGDLIPHDRTYMWIKHNAATGVPQVKGFIARK